MTEKQVSQLIQGSTSYEEEKRGRKTEQKRRGRSIRGSGGIREFPCSFSLERSYPRCKHCGFSVHIAYYIVLHAFFLCFFFFLTFICCLNVNILLFSLLLFFRLGLSCVWVHLNHVNVFCLSHVHSPWIRL